MSALAPLSTTPVALDFSNPKIKYQSPTKLRLEKRSWESESSTRDDLENRMNQSNERREIKLSLIKETASRTAGASKAGTIQKLTEQNSEKLKLRIEEKQALAQTLQEVYQVQRAAKAAAFAQSKAGAVRKQEEEERLALTARIADKQQQAEVRLEEELSKKIASATKMSQNKADAVRKQEEEDRLALTARIAEKQQQAEVRLKEELDKKVASATKMSQNKLEAVRKQEEEDRAQLAQRLDEKLKDAEVRVEEEMCKRTASATKMSQNKLEAVRKQEELERVQLAQRLDEKLKDAEVRVEEEICKRTASATKMSQNKLEAVRKQEEIHNLFPTCIAHIKAAVVVQESKRQKVTAGETEGWPEAWYMPAEVEDQKAENKLSPNKPVSVEKLQSLGIAYWNVPPENFKYPVKSVPWDPSEALDPKLVAIREERGYSYADIITVHPDHLPQYDIKVKAFFEEHIHDAEEIRYIIDGSGFFDVRDEKDDWIRIWIKKGDLMTLPEGIYHRFTCDATDFIHAMRLFKGQPIWTPFNRPQEDHKSRQYYVKNYINKLAASEDSGAAETTAAE